MYRETHLYFVILNYSYTDKSLKREGIAPKCKQNWQMEDGNSK